MFQRLDIHPCCLYTDTVSQLAWLINSEADMNDTDLSELLSPGLMIKTLIEKKGWTQRDFANILGRPLQTVNNILNGKMQITPYTARGLGHALGTSPEYWLKLEAEYRLYLEPDVQQGVALRAREAEITTTA